jgi:hypothetical protein
VSNWIGVWCVVLAAVMNEGAVDSIQNGMAAGITSYLAPMLKWWNLLMTRLVVVVLNAGLIGIAIWLVLGTVKVTVLELFLLTNMLCSTSAFPVLMGLSERMHGYYGGASFLFSCLFSIFCTCGERRATGAGRCRWCSAQGTASSWPPARWPGNAAARFSAFFLLPCPCPLSRLNPPPPAACSVRRELLLLHLPRRVGGHLLRALLLRGLLCLRDVLHLDRQRLPVGVLHGESGGEERGGGGLWLVAGGLVGLGHGVGRS